MTNRYFLTSVYTLLFANLRTIFTTTKYLFVKLRLFIKIQVTFSHHYTTIKNLIFLLKYHSSWLYLQLKNKHI